MLPGTGITAHPLLLREIYEKGVRAFVSFVRFYHKHECKLLFHPKGRCTELAMSASV